MMTVTCHTVSEMMRPLNCTQSDDDSHMSYSVRDDETTELYSQMMTVTCHTVSEQMRPLNCTQSDDDSHTSYSVRADETTELYTAI